MGFQVNLPESIEQCLRAAWGDLDRAAFESLVIEGYRTGRLSISEVAACLGLETRFDAESWLGQRGVAWNYSLADLESDRRTLAGLSKDRPR